MATNIRYQNIFTQVQVRGPAEMGVPLPKEDAPRTGKGFFNYWAGKFGNAQIGPIYLGTLGTFSFLTGGLAILIIGLHMASQVGWDPIKFVTLLPWLSLNQPGAEYGMSPFVPWSEGGNWIAVGALMTTDRKSVV